MQELVFQVANLGISVTSDRIIQNDTFNTTLAGFLCHSVEMETVKIEHHFDLPEDFNLPEDCCVYANTPLRIYNFGNSIIYEEGYSLEDNSYVRRLIAIWSDDYMTGDIYHADPLRWDQGNIGQLSCMPTDQVFLAELLANRQGCILHAGGVELDGKGFLFIGHKTAGKSTTIQMLLDHATVLCDDRVACRMMPDGPRIYGTWCNRGTIPIMSPASAPLRALCFIEQADTNEAIPITDPQEILRRLLPRIVKPLADAAWWEKTLAIVDDLIRTVPAYVLRRDLSGKVVDVLRNL